jgi:uncharacterized protein (TIGR03437 family)
MVEGVSDRLFKTGFVLMTRQQRIFWAKSAVILGVIPVVVFAYKAGPDPGKAAAPGDRNCTEAGCHAGTVNSGSGSVTVTFPSGNTYTPGVKQHLVVTVADPGMRRAGFQLTARSGSGNTTQAGSFRSTDNRTLLMCSTSNFTAFEEKPSTSSQACLASQPLQYIEHSETGYRATSATAGSYEFDWTPPATDVGPITIYVAGNGANGDGEMTGDRIYTRTYTLTPAAAGGNRPAISQGEVRNPSDVANSGITGGGFVQIKGTNLANIAAAGRTWTDKDIVGGKLPTSLDGTSVTINGKAAYVYFISPTQVNAIAPLDSNEGPVNVVVTSDGQASAAATVNLKRFAPAIFMYGLPGASPTWAVATRNPDGAIIGDASKVAGTAAAKPGDVLILWCTGLGATNPAFPDGGIPSAGAALTTTPAVTIGGVTAPYIGGAISAYAGLYQIAVTVPNVSDGDQRVVVTIGGESSRSDVTIYVKR